MLALLVRCVTREAAGPLLLALLLGACSSQPSRLYVLNGAMPSSQPEAGVQTARSGAAGLASGASRQVGTAGTGKGALLGVQVSVPEYLDRLDIVERTSANELKPNYGAQWGESLSVTATRSLVENLGSLLPGDDVV